ncbi:Hypothetical predicted protein [Mytilus galloprovincialis]|uniref:Uncharacterized protein n=1 Tax=Mytilus galloprovincialis TaxID=29158 RepID=A0A8B6HH88_MYTGA|nr:Hypothetical predicted protein [Mytilus galloprovincialis]
MELKILIHAHNDGKIIQREKTTCVLEKYPDSLLDFKAQVCSFVGVGDIAKELNFQNYDTTFAKLVKHSQTVTETFTIRTHDQYIATRNLFAEDNNMILINIIRKIIKWKEGTTQVVTTDQSNADTSNPTEPKKRKRSDRAEDKLLVNKLRSATDVIRNERQENQLSEFNQLLNGMEKSEAVTEHKIRCGICKEIKQVCAADRNNEGKIKYFKRKHYDKCLANSGSTSLKPKVVGQMQQFMKTFFSKQSQENTDTPPKT